MLCVRSDSQTLLWGRVTSYFSSCWESFGECLSARTFSQPKKDILPKVMLCSQGQCTSNDWFMRRTKTCSLCLNLGYHRRAIPASEPSMGSSVTQLQPHCPSTFLLCPVFLPSPLTGATSTRVLHSPLSKTSVSQSVSWKTQPMTVGSGCAPKVRFYCWPWLAEIKTPLLLVRGILIAPGRQFQCYS